jgi:hypothetical protein
MLIQCFLFALILSLAFMWYALSKLLKRKMLATLSEKLELHREHNFAALSRLYECENSDANEPNEPNDLLSDGDESLEWLNELLGRFWKTIRQSPDVVENMHEKLARKLSASLARTRKRSKYVLVDDVHVRIELGETLPTFVSARANVLANSPNTFVSVTLCESRTAKWRQNSKQRGKHAPAPLVHIDFECCVWLGWPFLVRLPVQVSAALRSIQATLLFDVEPLPSHVFSITCFHAPKIDYALRCTVGSFELASFVLDTLGIRQLVDGYIELALLRSVVYPNSSKKIAIPLSPKPSEQCQNDIDSNSDNDSD